MVERFIAPVLKTGDPSRGPGVRIPLPLLITNQSKSKPHILNESGVFSFTTTLLLQQLGQNGEIILLDCTLPTMQSNAMKNLASDIQKGVFEGYNPNRSSIQSPKF